MPQANGCLMALKLRFNLATILADGFTDAQRVTLTPFIAQRSVKREYGKRVIERIIERTQSSMSKTGSRFKKYSKAYADSRVFKRFGKSRFKPNLTLFGRMLKEIHIGTLSRNTVTVEISNRKQEQKARGHINGANNLPVRDFWGLPKKDQESILKDVLKDKVEEDE